MVTAAAARGDGSAEPSSSAGSSMPSPSETPTPTSKEPGADGAYGSHVEQPKIDASAEAAAFETALPRVLKLVGSVVAPTTLLTALMYYFGWLEAAAFFWYLGAQVTVLDLTVRDYLANSVDGLIPPLVAVAGAALLTLWVQQLLRTAMPAETRRKGLSALMPVAAVAGVVLVSLALADIVMRPVFPASFPEGRGLCLTIGVLLLTYAVRLFRLLLTEGRSQRAPQRVPGIVAVTEWGAVFILVSVGLFWAVGSYAISLGMSRGHELETLLSGQPEVVIYSEKKLGLQAPGVRELPCRASDAAYRFRYEGLKLVQQAGNQYLLLPAGWTHLNGAAILLPRSESLRLEFSRAGQVRDATC
jgi:hypothetical protein